MGRKKKVEAAVEPVASSDKPVEAGLKVEVAEQAPSKPQPEKSSSDNSDYEMHPKFAKFKTKGSQAE